MSDYMAQKADEQIEAGLQTMLSMQDQIDTLTAKVKRYEQALEFYANKNNWVDLYAGAQLPLNLRKQSVINNEDIEHVEELPGYSNECGGKKARSALNQKDDT